MMPCSFVSGDSIFNQIFKERTGSPLGTEREVNCLSFKAFTFPAPFKCHLNSGIPKHKNAPAVMFFCVPRQIWTDRACTKGKARQRRVVCH